MSEQREKQVYKLWWAPLYVMSCFVTIAAALHHIAHDSHVLIILLYSMYPMWGLGLLLLSTGIYYSIKLNKSNATPVEHATAQKPRKIGHISCRDCGKVPHPGRWGNKEICSDCWWKIQDEKTEKTWWKHQRGTAIYKFYEDKRSKQTTQRIVGDTPYGSQLPPKKFEKMNEQEWKEWVEFSIKQLTGKTANLTFGGKDA